MLSIDSFKQLRQRQGATRVERPSVRQLADQLGRQLCAGEHACLAIADRYHAGGKQGTLNVRHPPILGKGQASRHYTSNCHHAMGL